MPTSVASDSNVLLQSWTTPYALPPFDQIEDHHFEEAFKYGLSELNTELNAIRKNPAAPSFSNTIHALAQAGQLLTRVTKVFGNLTNTDTTDALQALEIQIYPKLTAAYDALYLDPTLFTRVEAVYTQRNALGLDVQDARLLELTYRDFVRAGAALSTAKKDRLKAINGALAEETTRFMQHLLAATKAFRLVVTHEADLAGLPASLVAAGKKAAVAQGDPDTWHFGLDRSVFESFMTYAEHRGLRQQLYEGYTRRGTSAPQDNRPLIQQIVRLRAERAALLGYASHAAWTLETTMAKTPQSVADFLASVWAPAVAKATSERMAMQALIKAEGHNFELAAWDWWHYAEKLRQQRYALDETQLMPYFPLEQVRDGAFYTATRLFGLSFKPVDDVPTWYPGVEAFEVSGRDGSYLGLFLTDNHARASKRGGAWMSTYRNASGEGPDAIRPLVTNNMNLMEPEGDAPTLLRYTEVETLFHEFGHALHGLMTQARYERFAGTSGSPRDYVEFPSQFMEHYAAVPDVLAVYAKHHETGAPIPDKLIAKLQAARTHNQGFATTEYLAASLLDMAWHTRTLAELEAIDDVEAFEQDVLAEYGLPNEIAPRYRSPYFAHIFSSPTGYASGYYAYLWSEILDADGFAAFEETGDPFDATLADRLATNVYAAGYVAPGDELYRRFRGRNPEIGPLLALRGLDGEDATPSQADS